jgi:hydrogenase nickel incorporation protein HypA/HybF
MPMHEMAIAMEVLKIVNEHLPQDQPVKIKAIRLKVGKLTAVVPESFKFCMEVVTKDTPAEGAEIVIEDVPLLVECGDCGVQSELKEALFVCPKCESLNLKVISGRDLFIESIEVEDNVMEEKADGNQGRKKSPKRK